MLVRCYAALYRIVLSNAHNRVIVVMELVYLHWVHHHVSNIGHEFIWDFFQPLIAFPLCAEAGVIQVEYQFRRVVIAQLRVSLVEVKVGRDFKFVRLLVVWRVFVGLF